ncbi:MAG TPA: RNA polymerase-binding protein DksA [Steroidobacteraceae bacterium]|nr:RNA polymerase-binding protein DksA [Steroidobacteraceae bacterium]
MPSKKPNKAAKRPGKATPKKATHKAAAPKKAARPPTKAKPIATSKVTVKPTKPVAKSVVAKPAITKPPRPKPAALKPVPTPAPKAAHEKVAPIKFDTRPLVMPSRAVPNDEDGDMEVSSSASLLAGPRNVKPYIARRGEQYMNKEQLEHFARILQNWKRDLMVEVDRTVLHMKDEAANFPDPNDRATQEEEFSLELRTRDRERKLIRKIDEALKRIEDGSYGYCLETGEEIGIKRLEARPVATLSVEAQERRERREKQYGDRDDRYR